MLTKYLCLDKLIMAFDTVSPVVKIIWTLGNQVRDRIQQLSENDECRQRIEETLKDLTKLGTDVKELESGELPPSCRDYLSNFHDALRICEGICRDLGSKGSLLKFAFTESHKKQLQSLNEELKKATNNLNLAFSRAILFQNNQLKEQAQKNMKEIKSTIVHPEAGVYSGDGKTRPSKILKPEVGLDGHKDLMVVKWKDPNKEVERYEIRYDDEADSVIAKTPDQCRTDSISCYSIKLGPPKISLGHMYTVQVRATNGAGPGEWSDSVLFRFKYGPPNRPSKPTLTVLSPTKIQVTARSLPQEDENGSRVALLIVEYTEKDSNDDSDWNARKCNLKGTCENRVICVTGLTPDTFYYFRIKMANAAGESEPSESNHIFTTQLVPGPPDQVCISKLRKSKRLKLRWKPPTQNSEAVHKYIAQIRRFKSKTLKWEIFAEVNRDKFSAKALGLKTDTVYLFRVYAVNNKGEAGEYSDEVKAETLFGTFGHAVVVTSALVGGTLCGPLVGGFLLGAGAAVVTDEAISDNKPKTQVAAAATARVAASVGGTLLGLLNAPIMGGITAYAAHIVMKSATSPQTSDDEGD